MFYDVSFTQVHEIELDHLFNHEFFVTVVADSEHEAVDMLHTYRHVNSVTGVQLSDSQQNPRFDLLN